MIKYKRDPKDYSLLTPCPFGEQIKDYDITINVGSIYCTHACDYKGEKRNPHEVECNHP